LFIVQFFFFVGWGVKPSCFLSVMWHGEALYGLGVQGVKVLILLGVSFLPSVAPVSQQDYLQHSRCLLLHSSSHLGSSPLDNNSPTTPTEHLIMLRSQDRQLMALREFHSFTHKRIWISSMNSNLAYMTFGTPLKLRLTENLLSQNLNTLMLFWKREPVMHVWVLSSNAFPRVSKGHMKVKKQKCIWPIWTGQYASKWSTHLQENLQCNSSVIPSNIERSFLPWLQGYAYHTTCLHTYRNHLGTQWSRC
jgi:hypothetical protein